MTLAPFPCPTCDQLSAVRISYERRNGEQYRIRECPECGRFTTTQNGRGEQFGHFCDDPPPEPPPEIEPLELPPLTARQALAELVEHWRLEAIWQKAEAVGEGRPVALRAGAGYSGRGDEQRFYEE